MVRPETLALESPCSLPPPRRHIARVRDHVLTAFVAFAAVFFWAGKAPAQTVQTNFSATIQWNDGWTYWAATADGQVTGFLATRDPASVPEHTFPTIWFGRQADGSFSWEGVSSGQTAFAAARAVETRAGRTLFNQTEIRGVLDDPAVETLAASLTPMVNGVAVGDIFQDIIPVLTEAQVDAVVNFAAQGAVSLTAANVVVEQDCNQQDDDETYGGGSNILTNGQQPSELESRLSIIAAAVDRRIVAILASPENPDAGGAPSVVINFCGWVCVPWLSSWDTTFYGTCGQALPTGNGFCKADCPNCVKTHFWQWFQANCSWGPINRSVTNGCSKETPQSTAGGCP